MSHVSAALQDQWHGSKCNLWSPTRTRWDYRGKLIFLLDMSLSGKSFKKCDDIFRQLSLIWAHSRSAHGTWILAFLQHGGVLLTTIICRLEQGSKKANDTDVLCVVNVPNFTHKLDKLFVICVLIYLKYFNNINILSNWKL